jgi:hypothetical protein
VLDNRSNLFGFGCSHEDVIVVIGHDRTNSPRLDRWCDQESDTVDLLTGIESAQPIEA